MLLGLRTEAQLVNVINDLAQVVTALDLVLNLSKYFADLVFDSIRAGGPLFEAVEIGEELAVDEIAKVIAGHGGVVVKLAVLALGRSPGFPAVRLVQDKAVLLAIQLGFVRPVRFQCVQVFQEQQPGSLLSVIQLRCAASLLAEHVVNILEGLFKHRARFSLIDSNNCTNPEIIGRRGK